MPDVNVYVTPITRQGSGNAKKRRFDVYWVVDGKRIPATGARTLTWPDDLIRLLTDDEIDALAYDQMMTAARMMDDVDNAGKNRR